MDDIALKIPILPPSKLVITKSDPVLIGSDVDEDLL